jgi:hypothetical protein
VDPSPLIIPPPDEAWAGAAGVGAADFVATGLGADDADDLLGEPKWLEMKMNTSWTTSWHIFNYIAFEFLEYIAPTDQIMTRLLLNVIFHEASWYKGISSLAHNSYLALWPSSWWYRLNGWQIFPQDLFANYICQGLIGSDFPSPNVLLVQCL